MESKRLEYFRSEVRSFLQLLELAYPDYFPTHHEIYVRIHLGKPNTRWNNTIVQKLCLLNYLTKQANITGIEIVTIVKELYKCRIIL